MKKVQVGLVAFFTLALCIVLSFSAFAAVLAGDVDGSGTVDASDARLALRYSVGLEKFTAQQINCADVDGTEGITASDARLILRASVGLEELKASHVHAFGEWQVERNSKRVVTGRHYRTCSCGETEYANCTYGERKYDSISAPTCTKDATYVIRCTVCNGAKIGAVAKLGHITTGAAATCTTAQICPRCNQIIVKALGHVTVNATCLKGAYCSRCKEVFSQALGHTPGAAATCTTDQTCIRCDYVYAKRLGHDYTVANNVHGTSVKGFYCTRCNGVTENKLETFNGIVNTLKTGYGNEYKLVNNEFVYNTVTTLAKNSMKSDYTTIDFGPFYTPLIENAGLTNDLKETSESYSPIYTGRRLKYTLPVSSSRELVCLLESGDAKSIDVSTVNSLTGASLLTGFADSFKIGTEENEKNYDTTPYKNTTVNKKLIKVVIQAKDETYNGTNGVKNLPATELTSLQKLVGMNIRDDAAEFGANGVLTETESSDLYSISMTMTLKQIASSGSATYYFDASTLAPVAAVYDTMVTMSQDVNMKFIFGLTNISGYLDPTVVNSYKAVYLFSEYFN